MDVFEEFSKLDLQKSFLGGVMLAVLYYFLLFDDGSAIDAQIAQSRQSIQQNKQALARVRQALEDQKKFEDEIKNITLNMKDFQRYFANDVELNDIQAWVSQLAEQHSLVVNSLKPVEKEKEFPKYKETAVEFKVEGPFHNLMEFISSLTKQERAIDFSQMKFKVTVKGDYPLVELTTVLVVYSALENEVADNG